MLTWEQVPFHSIESPSNYALDCCIIHIPAVAPVPFLRVSPCCALFQSTLTTFLEMREINTNIKHNLRLGTYRTDSEISATCRRSHGYTDLLATFYPSSSPRGLNCSSAKHQVPTTRKKTKLSKFCSLCSHCYQILSEISGFNAINSHRANC